MSPTWLELAVAVLLLWVAWRLGVALTPWVVNLFRNSRDARSSWKTPDERPDKPASLTNRKN